MEFVKKNWWIFALIAVALFLWLASKKSTKKTDAGDGACKKISYDDWVAKKEAFWEQNGNDWGLAHVQMIQEGYCEHTEK